MPLTNKDRKDLDTFNAIVAIAGDHLPLDFIIAVFQHLKLRQAGGYDHYYLLSALNLMKRLLIKQPLNSEEMALTLATLFLMESGHVYSEEIPYEVSAGLSLSFLHRHAPEFFNRADRRFISRNCKPVYPHSLKLSARVPITLMVHNVRILTMVVTRDMDRLVYNFIKSNNELTFNNEAINIEVWYGQLVDKFIKYYGNEGTVWNTVSNAAKEVLYDEIIRFQATAENKDLIKNLIHQNANRIFA